MIERTSFWRSVEEEYGESFEDVLIGYRAQGTSWKLIADILEVSYNTLRKWHKRLGISDGRRSTNTYVSPGLNDKAKALGYQSIEQLISDLRASGKTRKDIAQLLDCHPASLYRYTNAEAKEIVNITAAQVAARRASIKIAHAASIRKKKGQ